MSHTFKADGGTVFHHDGDYGGFIIITTINETGDQTVKVPTVDLLQLLANMRRDEELSRVEQRPWRSFL